MICEILYLENPDKSRFDDLKWCVENDYVTNKAEYTRKVTTVQSLLLKYQPNYNSNRNSQSNGVRNQVMFLQHMKSGDNKGNGKEKKKRPRINLYHITCNDCGDKGHYSGDSECSTQTKLKEDVESFRKTKQEKSANKPHGGGDQKALVNFKDASCSLMMGDPTEEWGDPIIPWTHVLPNPNKRFPTDKTYQKQDEKG